MKNLLTLSIFSALLFFNLTSARTINIPSDFPTVQAGIDLAQPRDTVLVAAGTYYENLQFRGRDIILGSHFIINQNYSYVVNTILDGGHFGSVIKVDSNESMVSTIEGFTIQNGGGRGGGGIYCGASSSTIRSNIIKNNNVISGFGGGIGCRFGAMPMISFNLIIDNRADSVIAWGGGISCEEASSAQIRNNIIVRNRTTSGGGGGIYSANSNPLILNCVFFHNAAPYGGAYYGHSSHETASNCILWSDSAGSGREIYMVFGSATITYSDIQGGYEGQGNINQNPRFRDTANGDYHLMSILCGDNLNSPCIDIGSPNYTDLSLDCLRGLGDTRSDMGAYGGDNSLWPTAITEDNPVLPENVIITQNYPNPFNAQTVIGYILPASSDVLLEVFDIAGRRLETLISGEQIAGKHDVIWDAARVSSGIYFYRLKAGYFDKTNKMLLLK